MSVDIMTILEAFETRLKTITGLRASPGEPDSANPPMAWAELGESEPMALDRNSTHRLVFDITVIVKPGTLRTARKELMGYLSPHGSKSIQAALDTDDTLGGAIDGILQMSIENRQAWGSLTAGGISYPSGVLRVEVMAG